MDRIEKLKDLLAANDKDAFLRHALALEYIKGGDDEKAKKLFQAILSEEPGYVGSYYHLAKLLERNNELDAAVKYYEFGMAEAKKAGDMHSYYELQAAWEDLTE
ncbi:MAG: tetratricopeptide repeat protein [Ferruginibacter sp.]